MHNVALDIKTFVITTMCTRVWLYTLYPVQLYAKINNLDIYFSGNKS